MSWGPLAAPHLDPSYSLLLPSKAKTLSVLRPLLGPSF